MEQTEPTPSRRVGANVRRLRSAQGLSLAELCDRMAAIDHEMSVPALSKIERGERRIDVDDFVAFANALSIDVNALLTDPDISAGEHLTQLWARHSELMTERRRAADRLVEELAVIDKQLDTVESELYAALDGRPDLQVAVTRAREWRTTDHTPEVDN